MISSKEIIYEIKQFISEEDLLSFNDFKDFVRTNIDHYVSSKLRNHKFMEHIITPIPISDFHGDLPRYHEIIQVAGSDNMDLRKDPFQSLILNTEVAAYMKRDSQDNVYVVHKKKAACADDCDTELIMNANVFAEELSRGTDYSLIKKTYSDYSVDEEGYCRSGLDRQYYLMRPTESAWHGLGGTFIKDCLNFNIGNHLQKYDFSIESGRKTKRIRTNFKEGIVLISHHSRVYDEEGFLMIPEDMPNLMLAISNFVQWFIFKKLGNEFKTNDYLNRENTAKNDFFMFNAEATNKELNHYSYLELAPIIARAKFKNHIAKTYDEILNRDRPDEFQQSINDLHDY